MNETCTVYKTVDYIGKRWSIIILLELYKNKNQPTRFNELKSQIPNITSKILSGRLKELTEKGLIKKKIMTNTIPVRCEYSLTKSGIEFISIIKQIKVWALKWNIKNKTCQNLDCENCSF